MMYRPFQLQWLLLACVCLAAPMTALAADQKSSAPPAPPDPGSFLTGAGQFRPPPEELKTVSVTEHRGDALPLDLTFQDEQGRPVQLKQYFGGKKPVVLQLGYFGCPMLCGLVTRGLMESVKEVSLNAGTDFDVIDLSIDPAETSQLAKDKKQSYMKEYSRPGTEDGWHFLVGQKPQIEKLAKAVGFNYAWVEEYKQFAHPAVLILLTPDGRVSRYLYGVRYDPQTLRLSLVEASAGKIGSAMDQIYLTCFQYDGRQGKYALAAINLMRLGGVLTLLVLGAVLIRLFRRGSRRAHDDTGTQTPAA